MVDVGVTPHVYHVALCLSILLHMDAAKAAAWVLAPGLTSGRARPGVMASCTHERLQEALESSLLAVDAEFLNSCVDPSIAALGRNALKIATTAARDVRIEAMVRERNLIHGQTVPSAQLVSAWNLNSEREDDGLLPSAVAASRTEAAELRRGSDTRASL